MKKILLAAALVVTLSLGLFMKNQNSHAHQRNFTDETGSTHQESPLIIDGQPTVDTGKVLPSAAQVQDNSAAIGTQKPGKADNTPSVANPSSSAKPAPEAPKQPPAGSQINLTPVDNPTPTGQDNNSNSTGQTVGF